MTLFQKSPCGGGEFRKVAAVAVSLTSSRFRPSSGDPEQGSDRRTLHESRGTGLGQALGRGGNHEANDGGCARAGLCDDGLQ
jgi:hypothetical protein